MLINPIVYAYDTSIFSKKRPSAGGSYENITGRSVDVGIQGYLEGVRVR